MLFLYAKSIPVLRAQAGLFAELVLIGVADCCFRIALITGAGSFTGPVAVLRTVSELKPLLCLGHLSTLRAVSLPKSILRLGHVSVLGLCSIRRLYDW